MRTLLRAPMLLGLLLAGGCDSLGVTDPNDPGLETLRDNPTRSGVATAATGLLIGARAGISAQNGYVSLLGILGRESYNFDPADPRFITEMLIGPLDGGSPAFGGNLFGAPYANIRNANIVLDALETVPGMTDAEKEATRGFAKTIQALDFLQIIVTRQDNGAPTSRNDSPRAVSAPLKSPRYTDTLARRARLNCRNVAGVSKPANPLPSLNGNSAPPANRCAFPSSRSATMRE